jgi:hypothetical protein
MSQGMGLKRIVKVSGVSQGVMWKLIYGKTRPDGTRTPSQRIRKETAERILTVEVDLADGACIDNTGMRRRLQALVAIGYSQSRLAQRLGIEPSNFTAVMHSNEGTTVGRARAVRVLYDELSMTPYYGTTWHEKSSAGRARNLAAQHGWHPPLAWDDDTIDDPAATPDRGEHSKRDVLEDYAWLIEAGESHDSALRSLGVSHAAFDRAKHRATKRNTHQEGTAA